MNEELLTTEDLSRLLQVSKSTIKRWTDEGRLRCFRTPGGHRKFRLSNVLEFVIQYHYDNDLTKSLLNPNSESLLSANDVSQKILLREKQRQAV